MATRDSRPFWLVHAELPPPLIIEAWSVEAREMGFTEMQAGSLCYWRWIAHIDPARVERWTVEAPEAHEGC